MAVLNGCYFVQTDVKQGWKVPGKSPGTPVGALKTNWSDGTARCWEAAIMFNRSRNFIGRGRRGSYRGLGGKILCCW